MVCRLITAKGCLDAIALLRHLPKNWHLVFCGDGPLRHELEGHANTGDLAGRIHVLGALGDVRPVYAAIDAYLFLTEYEPFGLVLGEAMAAGVPVFGWRREGEYCEPENPLITSENAKFFASGDGDGSVLERSPVLRQLASAIERYGETPEIYARMISNARGWVQSRFSPESQVEAAYSIYDQILRRRNERTDRQ
jgi:glycosyltransferase involved in cell wall biosynthesis